MAAAAMATTTLRVGCTVFANDFLHPALLAKEAASIDMLTGGRFEFGIGAGWHKREYDQVGIPFDPPGVRVGRMEEAVRIIKGLWGDGPCSFAATSPSRSHIVEAPAYHRGRICLIGDAGAVGAGPTASGVYCGISNALELEAALGAGTTPTGRWPRGTRRGRRRGGASRWGEQLEKALIGRRRTARMDGGGRGVVESRRAAPSRELARRRDDREQRRYWHAVRRAYRNRPTTHGTA